MQKNFDVNENLINQSFASFLNIYVQNDHWLIELPTP